MILFCAVGKLGLDVPARALHPGRTRYLERFELTVQRVEQDLNGLKMGANDAAPSGRDKTSLVLGAPNQPGAIVRLLQPLADAGISMSKLESRPARSANWEYVFFVVCEGHRDDARLAATLAKVAQHAAFFKILGSYPASSTTF